MNDYSVAKCKEAMVPIEIENDYHSQQGKEYKRSGYLPTVINYKKTT